MSKSNNIDVHHPRTIEAPKSNKINKITKVHRKSGKAVALLRKQLDDAILEFVSSEDGRKVIRKKTGDVIGLNHGSMHVIIPNGTGISTYKLDVKLVKVEKAKKE